MEDHSLLRKSQRLLDALAWVKGMVVVWFLRLCWLPLLVWGGLDFAIVNGHVPARGYAPTVDDAAIRVFMGTALGVLWFFGVRRRGPLTMNRGGRLEVPPWREAHGAAPEAAPDGYTRHATSYDRRP